MQGVVAGGGGVRVGEAVEVPVDLWKRLLAVQWMVMDR